MKRLLYSTTAIVVSAAMLISSCKNDDNKLNSGSIHVAPDTVTASEYAAFKQWKQDQANANATAAQPAAKQTVVVHKHYNVNKTEPAAQQTTTKKKGWSKAAKGTAIGAGAGAAAGALLIKNNRALGAAVGAAVGGGVGYGVGRSKDKKDGRVQ